MPSSASQPIDLRPLLARGKDPFSIVRAEVGKLQPEQTLSIITPFKPLPLLSYFKAEGHHVEVEQVGPEEWKIKVQTASSTTPIELDVRDLEPPEPLHKAMEALSRLGRGEMLILRTRFRPVHLLEMLEDEAFDWDCEEIEPLHWVSHFWRASEPDSQNLV